MTAKARWACLLGCATLIALRAPVLVTEPRLWAEEASVYLAYAHSQSLLRSLLFVPTSEWPAGYFNLPANLAATLAAFVFPLELAPVVGTSIAFVLQLVPLALVLWGRSRFWTTPVRRVMACLVLLLAPAVRPAVWLSVINSQVFCGLAAILLLGEDLRQAGPRRIRTYRLLLGFCGLSGIYASLLAPVFLLKARLEKSREAFIHSVILASTATLQVTAYAVTAFHFSIAPDRFVLPAWEAVPVSVGLEQVLQPLAGSAAAAALRRWSGEPGAVLGVVGLVGLIVLVAGLGWRREAHPRLFIWSFVLLAGATSVLAYGLPRGRYAVLPGSVLLLTLLTGGWGEPRWRGWTCRALVGVALVTGAVTYWREEPTPRQVTGFFGYEPGRPEWREEVRRWRRDPRYALRVWPYTADATWPAYLPSREEFAELRTALAKVEDFHLVTASSAAERRIAVAGLPADFKMLVRGRSNLGAWRVRLEVRMQDAAAEMLASVPLSGFSPGETFTAHLTPGSFHPEPGRDLGATRFVTLWAASRDGATAVVEIERVEIAPRVEGLLDDLLPARTLPRRLYHASTVRPLAREATTILALESLHRDGDLVYADGDAARAAARWSQGPEGLKLRTAGDGTVRYGEPLPYLLAAAPFATLAGPSGAVALNALLYAAMVALAWRDRRAEGRAGRLFVAGFFVAAAGFGFVFLPQPQVFEMCCLFVPVRLWIRGGLGDAGMGTLGGCGVLLALAIVQQPASAVILLALAADLAWTRRWRELVSLLAAATAVTAALALAQGGLFGAAPEGARQFASRAWHLYAARNGVVFGYPFVLLAVLRFVREAEERARLLLFATLVALTVWIAWQGEAGPLGSPAFAAVFPLFVLLPRTVGQARWLWAPAAVALVVTLGVVSSVWTPY